MFFLSERKAYANNPPMFTGELIATSVVGGGVLVVIGKPCGGQLGPPPCGISAIGQAWAFCPNGFNPTVEEGGSIPALKPARGFFGLVSNAVSC